MLLCEVVEGTEEPVEETEDLLGADASRKGSKADNIHEEHRHIVEVVVDASLACRSTRGNARREDLMQEELAVLPQSKLVAPHVLHGELGASASEEFESLERLHDVVARAVTIITVGAALGYMRRRRCRPCRLTRRCP